MDGEGLGGITPLRLSFLKQSLTQALDGSPYDDKMTVSDYELDTLLRKYFSIIQ